jgi:hypothetical protein
MDHIKEFSAREQDPNDQWLFKEPWSAERLAEYRKALKEYMKDHVTLSDVLTCDSCGLVGVCSLAFDAYNTNGDCLLSK